VNSVAASIKASLPTKSRFQKNPNKGDLIALSPSKMFSTTHPIETLHKPSYSINVCGSVCVNVCGLSASCLRHVSIAADVFVRLKK